jgi:hypothetical protein
MIGADPACPAGQVNLLKPFMPEAANHASSVNSLVYSVNRIVLRFPAKSPGKAEG